MLFESEFELTFSVHKYYDLLNLDILVVNILVFHRGAGSAMFYHDRGGHRYISGGRWYKSGHRHVVWSI